MMHDPAVRVRQAAAPIPSVGERFDRLRTMISMEWEVDSSWIQLCITSP
jgi:hypothetical protein